MNILWITFAPIVNKNGTLSSDMASARYRVIIPAKYLASQRDYQQTFICTHHGQDLRDISEILEKQNVVIFSKSFNPINEQIALIAKQKNIKVIFDICDNHFDSAKFAQHYKNMANLADLITVNTPLMADIVKQYVDKSTIIIPDPYEGNKGRPHFKPAKDKLNLLWFGSHTNLDSLQAMIPTLAPLSQQISLRLHIVTAANMGVEQACQQFNTQSPRFKLQFTAWSLEATQKAITRADVVVIPSLANTKKVVKSPNRVVESLWAGRFVVAHPLPSYQEFSQWAWIGEDLTEGIGWALRSSPHVLKRIEAAQQYIAQNYSPEKISLLWENAIGSS